MLMCFAVLSLFIAQTKWYGKENDQRRGTNSLTEIRSLIQTQKGYISGQCRSFYRTRKPQRDNTIPYSSAYTVLLILLLRRQDDFTATADTAKSSLCRDGEHN